MVGVWPLAQEVKDGTGFGFQDIERAVLVGRAHLMGGGKSIKAQCKLHKSCQCWLSCAGRIDEGLEDVASWFVHGKTSTAEEHVSLARDIKVKYGMKLRNNR